MLVTTRKVHFVALLSTLAAVSVSSGASSILTTTGSPEPQSVMVVPQFVQEKLQHVHRNMPRELRSLQHDTDVNTKVAPIFTEETQSLIKENSPLLQTALTFGSTASRSSKKRPDNSSNLPKQEKINRNGALQQSKSLNSTEMSPVFRSSPRLLGASPRIAADCLKPLFCHDDEDYINFNRLVIHHWDLPERTAVACGDLCLQLHPSTQWVFAKVIDMNEMLVCGCGDSTAVYGNGAGEMDDTFACYYCPDGNQKCGGPRSVSVYELDRSTPSCPPTFPPVATVTPDNNVKSHNLTYLGCFKEQDVQAKYRQTYLEGDERSVAACGLHCSEEDGTPELVMVTVEVNSLKCTCG